ncbi:Uncharacterized protein FKW44_007606 [Caligus rogercresseyi]|uniref:Synaptic functional regulator FMRP KH0 domain-containing protein n=1 Tax=Caligus rogercresseyi TaxID=217165 RepID=A0A7T8KEY7_CALRO|nr:Uncharacterized protein FKW44_007606 [Caligus rogercresseyi]
MPYIQDKDFYSFWIPLPSEMEDNYAENEDSHAVFFKSINACSVKYEPAKRSLRVVSTDKDMQRKAAMIQGMHFQNFTQKVLLKTRRRKSSGTWSHADSELPTATQRSSTCPVSSWASHRSPRGKHTAGPERGGHHQPGALGRDLDLSCHREQQGVRPKGEEAPMFAEDTNQVPRSLVGKVIGAMGGSFWRSWTRSLCCKYEDVVAMVPLPAINSFDIKKWYDNVLQVLVKVGNPGAA